MLSKYKDPIFRIKPLKINPYYDIGNLFSQVLGRELGERITVKRRPHGLGNTISLDVIVEGIDHEITPGQNKWTTTWYLSPADINSSYLIVGDSVYGKVGTGKAAY